MLDLKKLIADVAKAALPIAKAAAPTIAVAVLTHQAIKPVLIKAAKDAGRDAALKHLS